MPTIYKEVEVDVDLDDFDTAELVEELERRGSGTLLDDFDTSELVEELERRGSGTLNYGDGKLVLQSIYENRRLGKDYQQELDQLIWLGLGKIV